MAEAAERTGRHLVEAFHWRFHPLAARMREVVRSELGEVRHLQTCALSAKPGTRATSAEMAWLTLRSVGRCCATSSAAVACRE